MAEHGFEMRLERLFMETPAFADAEVFATHLEARLDRGWNFRRLLIGGLGLVGGLIGAAQVLTSGFIDKIAQAARLSRPVVSARLADVALAHFLPSGFPVNGEVFWMSTALAVIAAGFAISRLIREI